MPRKLATHVHVGGKVYGPGDTVPAHVADKITNPDAWASEPAPEPGRAPVTRDGATEEATTPEAGEAGAEEATTPRRGRRPKP